MGKVHVAVVASYRWYRSSHWLYDNPQRFEDQNILNVPNASILYTGSWYLARLTRLHKKTLIDLTLDECVNSNLPDEICPLGGSTTCMQESLERH